MLPPGLRILLGEGERPPQVDPIQTRPRPNISDWLRHNALSRSGVAAHLARIRAPGAALASYPATSLDLSAAEAWTLCAGAMAQAFPDLAPESAAVAAQTPKCLMPKTTKHPRPFTYDLGPGRLPFVSLHYRDRPADLLAMAHEFGHAVQIVASHTAGQMPPVARECCAFLAERALVAHSGDTCADLVQAYGADDAVYFGEHRAALARALAEAERPYAYIWNYPLARHLAAHLFDATAADQIAGLYRAGSAGGRALDRMAQGLARGERAA